MIAGVMRLGDRPVRAVMTPRRDVDIIDLSDDRDTIRRLISESPHSRLPVFDGNPAAMSGIVPFGSGGLDRLPKSTSRALEHVRGDGRVTAARVVAVAFVTHVGLHEIELLSMQ